LQQNFDNTDFAKDITFQEFKEGIIIYPNPTNGVVNIESETSINKITVFNIQGNELLVEHSKNNLDLSNFLTGIYFIKIEDNKGEIIVKRLIKE
jgi:hypothetical protein